MRFMLFSQLLLLLLEMLDKYLMLELLLLFQLKSIKKTKNYFRKGWIRTIKLTAEAQAKISRRGAEK